MHNRLWIVSWLDCYSVFAVWFRRLSIADWSNSDARNCMDWFNIGHWWFVWYSARRLASRSHWQKKFLTCYGCTANCKLIIFHCLSKSMKCIFIDWICFVKTFVLFSNEQNRSLICWWFMPKTYTICMHPVFYSVLLAALFLL